MNPKRQWSLLTAVGCLALLAAGWFLLISPKREEAAQLRTDAQAQQDQVRALQGKLSMLRSQQKDLPRQQALLRTAATQIPDNPALPTLIRTLTDAADTAGVNLVSLAPQPPALVGAAGATPAGATPAASGATATGVPPLAVIPLTLEVTGGYFELEGFFSQLEKLKRSFLVTGFDIGEAKTKAADAGAAASDDEFQLGAKVQGKVFMTPATASASKPAASPATTTG